MVVPSAVARSTLCVQFHLLRRMGITCRVSAFACAVTQFLRSDDMARLNRVCRQDHTVVESLWQSYKPVERDPAESSDCGSSSNLPLDVLRSPWVQPIHVAAAYSRAVSVMRQWSSGCWHSVRLELLDGFISLKIWRSESVYSAIFCSQREPMGGYMINYGLAAQTPTQSSDPFFVTVAQEWFLKHYPASNYSPALGTRIHSCHIPVFLVWLVTQFGNQVDEVGAVTLESAGAVITSWFGLQVAPTLRLYLPSNKDLRTTELYQRYHARIFLID